MNSFDHRENTEIYCDRPLGGAEGNRINAVTFHDIVELDNQVANKVPKAIASMLLRFPV